MVLNVLPFIIKAFYISGRSFKFSYDTIYFPCIGKEGNNTMVNEKRKVKYYPLYILEKLHENRI